jgi:upstream activation factor subunit UAF30
MATTKESASKKPTRKKSVADRPAARRGGASNPAFMKPLTPSSELAGVVGDKPLPRTEVVKKVWNYIKGNDLQDSGNRRMINADEKLRAVFGKNQVSMFEMTKIINNHLN